MYNNLILSGRQKFAIFIWLQKNNSLESPTLSGLNRAQ